MLNLSRQDLVKHVIFWLVVLLFLILCLVALVVGLLNRPATAALAPILSGQGWASLIAGTLIART